MLEQAAVAAASTPGLGPLRGGAGASRAQGPGSEPAGGGQHRCPGCVIASAGGPCGAPPPSGQRAAPATRRAREETVARPNDRERGPGPPSAAPMGAETPAGCPGKAETRTRPTRPPATTMASTTTTAPTRASSGPSRRPLGGHRGRAPPTPRGDRGFARPARRGGVRRYRLTLPAGEIVAGRRQRQRRPDRRGRVDAEVGVLQLGGAVAVALLPGRLVRTIRSQLLASTPSRARSAGQWMSSSLGGSPPRRTRAGRRRRRSGRSQPSAWAPPFGSACSSDSVRSAR